MRDGLPLILNIHDCGCYGRIPQPKGSISPFLLDRKLPGVLDTWLFCGFGKVIFQLDYISRLVGKELGTLKQALVRSHLCRGGRQVIKHSNYYWQHSELPSILIEFEARQRQRLYCATETEKLEYCKNSACSVKEIFAKEISSIFVMTRYTDFSLLICSYCQQKFVGNIRYIFQNCIIVWRQV